MDKSAEAPGGWLAVMKDGRRRAIDVVLIEGEQ